MRSNKDCHSNTARFSKGPLLLYQSLQFPPDKDIMEVEFQGNKRIRYFRDLPAIPLLSWFKMVRDSSTQDTISLIFVNDPIPPILNSDWTKIPPKIDSHLTQDRKYHNPYLNCRILKKKRNHMSKMKDFFKPPWSLVLRKIIFSIKSQISISSLKFFNLLKI